MKRSFALVALIIVCMAALALMPALASPQDPAGKAGDAEKFFRMGKDAIAGHYIVVLDMDSAGRSGDLFTAAKTANDLTRDYGGLATNFYAYAINGFSAQMSEAEALKL